MTASNFDRDSLLADYAEQCVDDMDLQTLTEIVTIQIIKSYDDKTDEELIEEIKKYYPALLEWVKYIQLNWYGLLQMLRN